MVIQIENKGSGHIGEVGNWNISAVSSPANVGQGGGSLGTISFVAGCNSTTKFTIDNYLSVKHFFSDQVTRWLSTFDANIRSVTTDGDYGEFSATSLLSRLNVERTAVLDTAGLYERTITLPSRVPYVIGATTYYTGGYESSVGLENVWVQQDISIYDVAAVGDFLYVLASGSHNGEVVFRFFADGEFQKVWPVYSDATDLAAPNSRHLAVALSYVFVGQQQADRVKMFDTEGVFIRHIGSSGSADGQFNTVSGVAASQFFNSVFVSDSILGRIQRFNYNGVYQNKWGTSGTGTGNTVFNAPNHLSIDPVTEHLFVADMNARVRVYDSFGNLQAQPMGSYDFVSSTSVGEYTKNRAVNVGMDQNGNAYGFQDGRIYMYSRSVGASWFDGSQRTKEWTVRGLGKGTYTNAATVDFRSGTVYFARDRNVIEAFSGTPGSLAAILNHYIALASPDFPVRYMSINEPLGDGPYPYIGWRDNVWDQLCDLCAATDNALAAFDDHMLVMSRTDRTYAIPENAKITPVQMNSQSAGLFVRVVNQNSRWLTASEVVYDAVLDDNKIFTVDVNGISYYTVEQNTHVQHVFNPTSSTLPAPGAYSIIGRDDVAVSPTLWRDNGGKIIASPGEDPGTILIALYGPTAPLDEKGGPAGPYRLSRPNGAATLSLLGTGVKAAPEVYDIGTGVPEEITSNLIARTINSPFLVNAAMAFTEGSWVAYNSGTPDQRVRITFSAAESRPWDDNLTGVGGTFQYINAVVYHDGSEYIIDSMQYNEDGIDLTAYRYNRSGHLSTASGEMGPRFEEIWNAKSAQEFEAFWVEHTAGDVTIAPLMNPFGYYAKTK